MTSKQKRSRKRYFTILIIYTILLSVAAGFVLIKVRQYGEELDGAEVSYALNDYMEQINNTKWDDSVKIAADRLAGEFQDSSSAENSVREFLAKDRIVFTNAVASGSVEKQKFKLCCQGMEIGTVTFRQNKNVNLNFPSFELYPWEFDSDEFNFEFLKNGSFSVEIPATFTLKLNGEAVGEEFITEKDIHYDVLERYYAEYPGLPTKVRYEIDGFIGSADTEILDASGNHFDIDPSKDDMQFVEPCPANEVSALQSFMENGFAEAYEKFWGTKWVDITYPTLLPYVKMGSALQQDMYTYTLDAATWVHTNSVVINSMSFNYALSLGGGVYVVSESVNSTAYADYKTVEESSDVVVLVVYDNESGQYLAIDRA